MSDRKAITLLLMIVVGLGVVFEVGTRLLVPRVFPHQQRIRDEYETVTQLQPGPPRSVLFLGNSLTLTDIDPPIMARQLGPEFTVRRWSVDDTNYLDWYFALRKAFKHGGKPSIVIIGGTSKHFAVGGIREGVAPRFLVDRSDLPAALTETGADPNRASEVVASHLSEYYASRQQIYKRLMTAVVPHFPRLARRFGATPGAASKSPSVEHLTGRLERLKSLCAASGAELILWLAPSEAGDRDAPLLIEAGRRAGVPVLQPYPESKAEAALFEDGAHLKASAAGPFTEKLAAELKPLLVSN